MSSTSRHGRNSTWRSTTGQRETNRHPATTTRRRNPLQHLINRGDAERHAREYANFRQRHGGSRKKLNKKRRTRKA
jgi:hypothetical protein